MKADIENTNPEFTPVTITITCETENELRQLYSIFNVPAPIASKHVGTQGARVDADFGYNLWANTVNRYFTKGM